MEKLHYSGRNSWRRAFMKRYSRCAQFICALIFSMLLSVPTPAQAPLEPAQMPPRTSFYLIWRGTPAGDARKTNSLFALWDDPDFAPVRAAMFENMTSPVGTKMRRSPRSPRKKPSSIPRSWKMPLSSAISASPKRR